MLHDERIYIVHRVLAGDAVDVPIVKDHMPPVEADSICRGEVTQSNLGAFRQKAFVVRAMNKGDRNSQPVEVRQVYVVALKVDQVAGVGQASKVHESFHIGHAKHFVQGVVRLFVQVGMFVEGGIH